MKKSYFLSLLVVTTILSLYPDLSQAATLRFSPLSNTYQVGSTFLLNVNVSSPTQSLNAATGVVSFPKDKLEVVSLTKNGSIFNFWVTEPSYSNSTGVVNFEGLVLNPGFVGQTGKIITITFRVKAEGSVQISFNSGSILANDGQGSNILTGLGKAEFNLKKDVDSGLISVPTALADELIGEFTEDIVPPTILDYPKELRRGKTLVISGHTYENSKVSIWFQNGSETINQYVVSDSSGNFSFVIRRDFNEGVYNFWATVTHFSGIQSGPSDQLTLVVKPSLIEQCGLWAMKALAVLAPIAILLILFAFVILFAWYKFKIWKKRLKKEVQDVEDGLHKAFDLLQQDIHNNKMKTGLSQAEKYIDKEVKDVKKELK